MLPELGPTGSPPGVGWRAPDFVLSYNWPRPIPAATLACFAAYGIPTVNLHIAYLPYNRGRHPNVWAWYDGTPHGITVHEMDAGIDTGPVLSRRPVDFGGGETLRTTYDRLHAEMFRHLTNEWSQLRRGRFGCGAPQAHAIATSHRGRDLERLRPLLAARGWDTPVTILQEAGRRTRGE